VNWFVVPARARHARVRLLCLPYTGSGAAAYPELAPLLDAGIAPAVARLPGRDVRQSEPACRDFGRLVDELATAAARVPRPLAVFGHSLGALLAFELARELERRDAAPVVLIVSGSRPPSAVTRGPDPPPLTPAGFLDWASTQESVPAAVLADRELKRQLLEKIEVDLDVRRSYTPDPEAIISTSIVAFAGAADTVAPVSDMEQWRAHTRADLLVEEFDGGHFYFRNESEKFRASVVSALGDARPDMNAGKS
jgi:surfactin synthase thioesterase subunit